MQIMILAIGVVAIVPMVLYIYRLGKREGSIEKDSIQYWTNHMTFTLAAIYFAEGKTFTLQLQGYSMRPFLEHGRDKGVLAGIRPEDVKVGDVVLAEFRPQCYALHRVTRIYGDRFDMLGDGNLNPEHCRLEDIRAIAIGFYRKGSTKMDSVESRKWKAYSYIWMKLLPIRRYLLFLYRVMLKIRKQIKL